MGGYTFFLLFFIDEMIISLYSQAVQNFKILLRSSIEWEKTGLISLILCSFFSCQQSQHASFYLLRNSGKLFATT